MGFHIYSHATLNLIFFFNLCWFIYHLAPARQNGKVTTEPKNTPNCSESFTDARNNKWIIIPILWLISNLDLAQKDPIIFKIPVSLGTDEAEFCFVLIPNWIQEDQDCFASLNLYLTSQTLPELNDGVAAGFSASVLIGDKNDVSYKRQTHGIWNFQLGKNKGWGWQRFVSHNELKMMGATKNSKLKLDLELQVKNATNITKDHITVHSDANKRKITHNFKCTFKNISHFFGAYSGKFPALPAQNFKPYPNVEFFFQLITPKSNNCCDVNLVLQSSEQNKGITVCLEIGIYDPNTEDKINTEERYAILSPGGSVNLRDYINFDYLKRKNLIQNDQLAICGKLILLLDVDDGDSMEQLKNNVQIALTLANSLDQVQNNSENDYQTGQRCVARSSRGKNTTNITVIIGNSFKNSLVNTFSSIKANSINLGIRKFVDMRNRCKQSQAEKRRGRKILKTVKTPRRGA